MNELEVTNGLAKTFRERERNKNKSLVYLYINNISGKAVKIRENDTLAVIEKAETIASIILEDNDVTEIDKLLEGEEEEETPSPSKPKTESERRKEKRELQ